MCLRIVLIISKESHGCTNEDVCYVAVITVFHVGIVESIMLLFSTSTFVDKTTFGRVEQQSDYASAHFPTNRK